MNKVLKLCQFYLRQYYAQDLCTIPRFPGDYTSLIDLKDIFIKISINLNLPKPLSITIPLDSYDEIFTYTDDEGGLYQRMLISAAAGLGKTTLTAKMANDWATESEESSLKDTLLLFVLNMKWIDHSCDVEDAILRQMFPEDAGITATQLRNVMKTYEEKIVIICDAIDETDSKLFRHLGKTGSIVKLLTGKILRQSRVLLTTRPWRETEIIKECKPHAIFRLSGFPKDGIKKYIKKFFKDDPGKDDLSLLDYMQDNARVADLMRKPLIALLVCVYWKEIKEKKLPNRIGTLYNGIINVMHKHQQEKDAGGIEVADDEIVELVCQLGKMALKGMWPPENRVDFDENEAPSRELVDRACQMGLLNKQEHPSVLTLQTHVQASLTFFHKTGGEKCAGTYLGYLATENADELQKYLQRIEDVEQALSVEMILQFASGENAQTADFILQRLMEIFRAAIQQRILEFCTEELSQLSDVLQIQHFIQLCLACNYEADQEGRFNSLLMDLFPDGKVFFLGIPAHTAEALAYFLSNSRSGDIRSLTLRPVAHVGDNISPLGTLRKARTEEKRKIRQIPQHEMRTAIEKYFENAKKRGLTVHQEHKDLALSKGLALMLASIQMWEACKDIPTAEESNIRPIISSLRHVNLEVLNIPEFKIGPQNIDHLLEVFENDHLSQLKELRVSNLNMTELQVGRLLTALKRVSRLNTIDISKNRDARKSVQILVDALPSMDDLQNLYIEQTAAPEETMIAMAQQLGSHRLHLKELHINGTFMNNKVARQMIQHLPKQAISLEELFITIQQVNWDLHMRLLSVIGKLSRLKNLGIFRSKYPEDLVDVMSGNMASFQNLKRMTLVMLRTSTVRHSKWLPFFRQLKKTQHLSRLSLWNIKLEREDFLDLVEFCRGAEYDRLQ